MFAILLHQARRRADNPSTGKSTARRIPSWHQVEGDTAMGDILNGKMALAGERCYFRAWCGRLTGLGQTSVRYQLDHRLVEVKHIDGFFEDLVGI